MFNHLKNVDIKTICHNKNSIEINCTLITKFSHLSDIFVEFLCDHSHFITTHINDITDPSYHSALDNNLIYSNTWYGVKLDDTKRYELKIFSEGVLLYKTILVKGHENVNKFTTTIHQFDQSI